MKQRTIGKEFRVTGMGLHTGRTVTVTVRPAPPDSGIAFRRTDRFNIVTQKALAENVSETKRGTTLGSGRHSVATIEHLMSALHGCEVDNVLVELDGGEVPILDGSARPWMMQLTRVGTVEQPAERRVGKVAEKLHFEHSSTGSVYEVEPADGFSVECVIDFPGSVIGRQSAKIESLNEYAAGIAPCRTFVFLHEIEPLLHLNLIKGGSLDNAIILHDGALICKDGLRYPNELVRHKIMDMIGDLFLVGKRVHAHVMSVKSGHPTHCKLAALMLEQEAAAAAK